MPAWGETEKLKQVLVTGQQDHLPTTMLSGVRLYIGSTGDYPNLFGAGMNLAVGYQAVVALSPVSLMQKELQGI